MKITFQPLQKLVIASWFAAILLRAVYPPWIERVYWRDKTITEQRAETHGSVVAPPYRYISYAERSELRIDLPMLMLQWFTGTAIAAALVWALKGVGAGLNALVVIATVATLNLVVGVLLILQIRSAERTIAQRTLSIARQVSSLQNDLRLIQLDVGSIQGDVDSIRWDVSSIDLKTAR